MAADARGVPETGDRGADGDVRERTETMSEEQRNEFEVWAIFELMCRAVDAFGITPTTEDLARKVAVACTPAPVTRWELPAPGATTDRQYRDEDDES